MNSSTAQADKILKALAAGVFFIFFNGYMIAPLIPALAREFSVSTQKMGLVIPAYMLTYGFATLIYGALSDRIGRKRVLLVSLSMTLIATALGAFAWSADSLIGLRILSGACAGGFLPISLALIGDLYPYDKIGRPLGWMFGAVAGGMSFGSTVGAWLNPIIGWRFELVAVSISLAFVFTLIWRNRALIAETKTESSMSPLQVLKNYVALISTRKGSQLYTLVFLNGAFQSGLFSWFGLYLVQRYGLSDFEIGTALIGYGLPGLFLGPVLGRAADHYGRRVIIPVGFLIGGLCALALVPKLPVLIAAALITILSVGFDMTHPLMTGVVTKLDPARRGQAMGLNAFAIFMGFGLGSLAFQLLLKISLERALFVFGSGEILLVIAAALYFKNERRHTLTEYA